MKVVRKLFDAVARRDNEAVLSLYDPDIEFDGTRHRWAEIMGTDESRFRGHDGLREWSRRYYEVWGSIEDTLEELIDAGDQVITVVTTRGRGRGSGVEVEWKHNSGVWTISDGKITRVVWFPSREEALEAAGLSE